MSIDNREEVGARKAGKAVGGQFTAVEKTEAAGTGLPSADSVLQNGGMVAANSTEGSFCFPPRFENADELISYMETAHIEDITLSNVSFAYNDFMRAQVDAEADAWWKEFDQSAEAREWEADAKSVGDGNGSERFQRWMNDRLDVERRNIAADKRMNLSTVDARLVAVYGNIARRSGGLSQEEAEKAMSHEFLEPGSGKMATVRQYTEFFHTSEWLPEALTTSDLRTARATERVWEALNGRGRW